VKIESTAIAPLRTASASRSPAAHVTPQRLRATWPCCRLVEVPATGA